MASYYKVIVISGGIMDIHKLKTIYENLLHPIFGEQFRIDDSDEDKNQVVIILDGSQEEFIFHYMG